MAGKVRAKELSLQRPRHEVDLVEGAVEDGGPRVLCVAAEKSKTFVIVKLVELWNRSCSKGKRSIILIEESEDQLIKHLLDGFRIQTSLIAKSIDSGCSRKERILRYIDADIILSSGACFLNSLAHKEICLRDLSLVVINSCHHALDKDHSVAKVVDRLTWHYQQTRGPKLVGVTSELLAYQSCSREVESFLSKLEEVFQCCINVSSDLLAMNKYGEQIMDECSSYSDKLPNDAVSLGLAQVLHTTLSFLKDCQQSEETRECISFVTLLMSECHKVLQMFGPWSCAQTAKVIVRECAKFAKRYAATGNEVYLHFCRTQATLLHSREVSLKGNVNFTSLTGKLFGVLAELRVDGEIPQRKPQHEHETHESMNSLLPTETHEDKSSLGGKDILSDEESLKSEVTNSSSEVQVDSTGEARDRCLDQYSGSEAHLLEEGKGHDNRGHCVMTEGEQNNSPKTCPQTKDSSNKTRISTDPFCLVFVRSTIIAQALSNLINALAATLPEHFFLSSRYLCGKKATSNDNSTQESLDGQEGVMRSIQDGSINVLVTTYEAELHIYAPRCSLVIRLGIPPLDYVHYQQVKQKARAMGAKFVVFVPEEKKEKHYRQFQELQQIEFVLRQRCPGFCAPATQISGKFAATSLPAYKPYGDGGPMVDMLTSIALINRYCERFPNDGLNFPIPRLRTEERWTGEDIKFVSYLYLPRNSPIYWPIKGFTSVKTQYSSHKAALDKARAQSQMSAALNACVELHQRGELDSNLDPVGRGYTYEFVGKDSICEDQVADGVTGLAGSMKRRRGYKKKIPSVFDDNLPKAGEEVFVYSIIFILTKPGKCERAIRSQISLSSSSSMYSLGILSRRPLPPLPDLSIHDRVGEMMVTVAAWPNSLVLSHDQVSLAKRFHGYVFKHILKLGKTPQGSVLNFDLESAVDGYLIVLLKNAEDVSTSRVGVSTSQIDVSTSQVGASSGGTVAFEFMHELEKSLGDFEDPKDPPPAGLQDFEVFRHKVLVSTYSENKSNYYVVDICYDRSPMDPFPSPEIAASFKEYYDMRHNVNISPNQPLLDVDHCSVRLNFLVPRYQNTKGQDLTLPGKASKRALKAKVYLIPELCCIHPIPAYLWRRITNLPSILYRMELLLLAEELRSTIARETCVGSVEWPSDVPLPPLTAGELVGESFQPVTPVQDARITKESEKDYLTEVSLVEGIEGIMDEHGQTKDTSKKQRQGSQTLLPVDTHLDRLCADPNSDAQSRRSSVTLDESCHTRNEGFNDSGMTAQVLTQGSSVSHSKAVGNVEDPSDTSIQNHVPVRCDSDILFVPQLSAVLSAPGTVQQAGSGEVENASTLTVKKSEHLLQGRAREDGVSQSKAIDSAGESVHTSSAQSDPPVKCDSGISAIIGEGDTIQELGSVPVESISNDANMFAPHGPPCTLVLRALTCNSACDMFSLERLEMYGDSFVKHVVSSELFHKYPHDNEGRLSFIRGLRISNRQLFYLGRRRGIPAHMSTRVFDPASTWIPPCFCVDVVGQQQFSLLTLPPSQDAREDDEEDEETCFGDQAEEVTGTPTANSPHLNFYLHHVVSDKAVADVTEALVGAYLLCCGTEGAVRLLSWLGMDVSFHKKAADVAHSEVDVRRANSATAGSEIAVDRDYALQKITTEFGAIRIGDMVSHESSYVSERRDDGPSAYARQATPTQATLNHLQHVDADSLLTEFQEDSLKHIDRADADSLQPEFQEDSSRHVHRADAVLLQPEFQEDSLRRIDRADADSLQPEFQEVEDSSKYVDRADADPLQPEFQEIEDSLRYVVRADADSLLTEFQEDSLKHIDQADADSLQPEFQEIEGSLRYVVRADADSLLTEFQEDSLKHIDQADADSLQPEFQEVEDSLRHVDRSDTDSLQQEFQEVEKSLKYAFTDKSLLLQAFTHSSYPREYSTAVKSSYEQLEFMGDALMDFLLTQHLYFSQRDKDPGAMTDLRSALVNNYIFASLAVKCGFHRHLRSMSPSLFKIVNEFVIKQEEAEREQKPSNPDQVFSTVLTLPSVNDEDSVDVEVPKALGDVFEAVVGAVYVDSGMDLEKVWHVFFPLMKPSIEHYSVFLPLSPIRQLLEMKINAARFSPPERTMDGKYKCTLTVNGVGKFVGLGRSFRIAKSTAAQRALKRIRTQEHSK